MKSLWLGYSKRVCLRTHESTRANTYTRPIDYVWPTWQIHMVLLFVWPRYGEVQNPNIGTELQIQGPKVKVCSASRSNSFSMPFKPGRMSLTCSVEFWLNMVREMIYSFASADAYSCRFMMTWLSGQMLASLKNPVHGITINNDRLRSFQEPLQTQIFMEPTRITFYLKKELWTKKKLSYAIGFPGRSATTGPTIAYWNKKPCYSYFLGQTASYMLSYRRTSGNQ